MPGSRRCLLLDWGDTLMRNFPDSPGPMSTWPIVEPVPGVPEVLAHLRPDWTLALATNAADSREPDIRAALARAGLDELIDRIYCYHVIGHRKSEPAYFEHVLADLGIERRDAVMVGDDFEADVLPANRAGIRAIWFDEGGAGERIDDMHRTIHRMRDLPAELDLLLR